VHLICAATIEELQPLLARAAFVEENESVFRHRGKPVLATAFGIGLVDFASGFQAFLQNFQIKTAVLTGTCGVYPEAERNCPIGVLVAPDKISLADFSLVNDSGYLPSPVIQSSALAGGVFPDSNIITGGHCLTLTTITADDQVAKQIANHYQAHYEQMEAYAFARLCRLNQVDGSALFAVSNRVGCDSHAQWLTNAQSGVAAVAEVICERFSLG